MRGALVASMGMGTLRVFCIGMVVGVLTMSLVSNFTSVSNNRVYKSLIKSLDGQELVALMKEYNKTLSLHGHQQALKSHKQEPVYFRDEHFHNDDDSVAKNLYKKVRVLCWVLTTQKNHGSKAVHVKATWGKRCNKLLFISDADDASLPAVKINTPSGRDHLTAKTMQAFDLLYKDVDKFDWFLKADDDTYVIVENLRYFLSSQNPDSPIYFGHHFKSKRIKIAQGYFSGGGGYAISREALRRYGKRQPDVCVKDGGDEDVEFGRCMEKLGVKTGYSLDRMGRSRFHSFDPALFINGGFPDWYYQYDTNGAKTGMEHISDYAISFHYAGRNDMYIMELFIYHIRPYGVSSGDQDINVPVTVTATTLQNVIKGKT